MKRKKKNTFVVYGINVTLTKTRARLEIVFKIQMTDTIKQGDHVLVYGHNDGV